ncbi:MAG: DUF739 family protein [Oscillospiraceae bacterium]|nr:DUF739 family protein [Oscillospiraceae bacterium]MBQ8996382.1 DUF739 family protein [Oscillospiraceae bacterium]
MANSSACFDYSKVVGRMAEMSITRAELAPKIGINTAYFGTRLLHGKPFTSDVILRCAQVLDIEAEDIGQYFFTLKP